MSELADRPTSRRGALRGLTLSATGLASIAAGLNPGRLLAAQAPVAVLGFSYITKRPELTIDQMIDRYENGHVPRALTSPMRFFPRYSRNFVRSHIGIAPSFDCIMESAPTADFPVDFACGRQIDPNWLMVITGQVEEHLLHGPAWAREAGPIRKVAYLIHSEAPVGDERDRAIESYARALAAGLTGNSRRVMLYLQRAVRHVHACVPAPLPADAVLMAWPTDGFAFPTRLPPCSSDIRVGSVLDMVAYASDVPQPRT